MNDILNPKWLESLPNEVVSIFQEISAETTAVICKRINAIGKMSRTDAIKLTNAYEYLGADFGKIERIIKKKTGKSSKEIEQMFTEVAEKNEDFARVFYEYRGKTPLTHLNDDFLSSTLYTIQKQTESLYRNFSNTRMIGYNVNGNILPIREAYIQVIDKAIFEVQSGTLDYNTAMRQTVARLGGGIQQIEWESGYHRRLDSTVRMNLLDSVRQMNQKVMDYHAEQYGADGVELSAHAISAPDHAPLQGKQYSKEEFEKMQTQQPFEDAKGRKYKAIERPIGEWNCKHFAFPIVLGVSSQFYNDEELKDFEENSKDKYGATQQMRSIELALRKAKERQMAFRASGDINQAREAQRHINLLQAKYKALCEKKGLTPQWERASMSGYRKIKA